MSCEAPSWRPLTFMRQPEHSPRPASHHFCLAHFCHGLHGNGPTWNMMLDVPRASRNLKCLPGCCSLRSRQSCSCGADNKGQSSHSPCLLPPALETAGFRSNTCTHAPLIMHVLVGLLNAFPPVRPSTVPLCVDTNHNLLHWERSGRKRRRHWAEIKLLENV